METFFDCETSGFINKKLSYDDPKQAWIMEVAFILSDKNRTYNEFSTLIKAEGRTCHPGAQSVHGISVETCDLVGMYEEEIIQNILQGFFGADRLLIAHNFTFDIELICQYLQRNRISPDQIRKSPYFCTMKKSTDLCRLPGKFGNYKWPKLTELYRYLFNESFDGAHSALEDVRATRRCYYKLKEIL